VKTNAIFKDFRRRYNTIFSALGALGISNGVIKHIFRNVMADKIK